MSGRGGSHGQAKFYANGQHADGKPLNSTNEFKGSLDDEIEAYMGQVNHVKGLTKDITNGMTESNQQTEEAGNWNQRSTSPRHNPDFDPRIHLRDECEIYISEDDFAPGTRPLPSIPPTPVFSPPAPPRNPSTSPPAESMQNVVCADRGNQNDEAAKTNELRKADGDDMEVKESHDNGESEFNPNYFSVDDWGGDDDTAVY